MPVTTPVEIVAEYLVHHARPESGVDRPPLALLTLNNAHVDLPDYMECCAVPLVPLPDARHSGTGFIPPPATDVCRVSPLAIRCADGEGLYRLVPARQLVGNVPELRHVGAPTVAARSSECPLGAALGALFSREYPEGSVVVGAGFVDGAGTVLVAQLYAPRRAPEFGFPPTAHERMAARRV